MCVNDQLLRCFVTVEQLLLVFVVPYVHMEVVGIFLLSLSG